MQSLDQIAAGAIQLAELAPRLEAVVAELELAVSDLNASSGQMATALTTVKRVADQTRILSINAAIEAGRAGENGRAFGVVVDEIKTLADHTAQTTHTLEDRVSGIQGSVARVSAAASGAAGAAQVGGRIKLLTDSLLEAVGKFRFEAHARAQRAVATVLPSLAGSGGRPDRLDALVEMWLRNHGYFELAYVTDGRGKQLTDNLRLRDGLVTRDASARGKDWSVRPWFREACAQEGACATDLYRSAATGQFCFTVAAAWRTPAGQIAGVVGADVNFQKAV